MTIWKAVKLNLKHCWILLVAITLVAILMYLRLMSTQTYALRAKLPKMSIQTCSLLQSGETLPNDIVYTKQFKLIRSVPDHKIYQVASETGCDWITKQFSKDFYISEDEKKFPLAFALNVFESPYQILRFLKIIYRPHNLYCIHYDQTSKDAFKQFIKKISNCLPNVIVPKKITNVVWGWHTIIDAQLNCIDDLFKMQQKFSWQYVLTLCGKEVPLKTNMEMVKFLRRMNGTSAVGTFDNLDHESSYWTDKFKLWKNSVVRTKDKLGPIPFGLTIKKSMAYYGLSVPFVNYILHNTTAIEFRHFMEDTFIPDEHFIATLFTTKGVPGGKNDFNSKLIPTVSDYIWLTGNTLWKKTCSGLNVHDICIVSGKDLHRLAFDPKKPVFFHNKFFIENDQIVMDCAEHILTRRNQEEEVEHIRDAFK